jgi:hypothetical protein
VAERWDSYLFSHRSTGAGGLVMKAALQALLPGFLGLLATDYKRWAAGDGEETREAAGKLVEP